MSDNPGKGKGRQKVTGPDLSRFRKSLLAWYRREGRRLPWRQTRDPYKIWVSEVMLQQTQVATVVPYYYRFVRAFPTVEALALAPLQKVLKLWEGLGYYARARNLHRAARQVTQQWDGRFPSDPALLQTLPGVGRSTAGAVASLAFERRSPILDGNLRRLFSRLLAITAPLENRSEEQRLWDLSERVLPRQRVNQFNQALMDLGAMVCTPRNPDCPSCPVQKHCRAYQKNIQASIPPIPVRKKPSRRHAVCFIVLRGDRILIMKRHDGGLLGGLWGLPEIAVPDPRVSKQAIQMFLKRWGVEVRVIQTLESYTHRFSHIHMTYYPLLCRYVSGTPPRAQMTRWITAKLISSFPFSSATHRILARVPGLNGYNKNTVEQPLLVAEEDPAWQGP